MLSDSLVAGGSPWRLLHLGAGAVSSLTSWRAGTPLEARNGHLARDLVDRGLVHPRWRPDWNRDVIDVIVPVRESAEALGRLLARLVDYSVTVVDDGSLDEAGVSRCAQRYGARLVRLDQNRGPGGARNAGAALTTRPWLWFIDVDVVLDDAAALGARLLSSGADPRVGAVAPRVRGAGGPRGRDRFERNHGPLDLGEAGGLVVAQTARGYLPSACLLVRRDAFGDGFDEALRVGEDVDLVWRLSDAGWLVRYDADLVVGHDARTTWSSWWRQRCGYGSSAAVLATRHGSRLAPIVVDEPSAWVLGGALAGQPLLVAAGVLTLVHQIRERLPDDVERTRGLVGSLLSRATIGAGGPIARGLVRTYGPLVLTAALVVRARRRALLLFALGTLWRWRDRGSIDVRDVPLALADDLAYALGVWRGAWRARDATAVTPVIRARSDPRNGRR